MEQIEENGVERLLTSEESRIINETIQRLVNVRMYEKELKKKEISAVSVKNNIDIGGYFKIVRHITYYLPAFHIADIDRVIVNSYSKDKLSNWYRYNLEEVRTKLKDTFKKHFQEGFRLDVFGSSENGFGTIGSDLDVSFRFDECFTGGHQHA
ncbi:hypothetical protein PFISCL1PPCAC_12269, partial [Pristionchus fissidentatus]